jgi:hypothetical protein
MSFAKALGRATSPVTQAAVIVSRFGPLVRLGDMLSFPLHHRAFALAKLSHRKPRHSVEMSGEVALDRRDVNHRWQIDENGLIG